MGNNIKIYSFTKEKQEQLEKEWFKKFKVNHSCKNFEIIEFKKWNITFLSKED